MGKRPKAQSTEPQKVAMSTEESKVQGHLQLPSANLRLARATPASKTGNLSSWKTHLIPVLERHMKENLCNLLASMVYVLSSSPFRKSSSSEVEA